MNSFGITNCFLSGLIVNVEARNRYLNIDAERVSHHPVGINVVLCLIPTVPDLAFISPLVSTLLVWSCPVVLVEKFAASQGNRQAALLRQLVTATQRLTKPLCVEYIAAAEDGMGRLYARQISAQSLTKEARYLLYGQNHKEVDMSGAHYELLRRCVGVSRLPPIAQLREAIWTVFFAA